MTPGKKFREAVKNEHPLAIAGCVNAYFARLATQAGFKAIYLSGGGVAACSCGIPDLGITTMEDVLIDAQRITDNVDTPLLVDIDVGWGGAFNIARTIRSFEKAGVAAVHIEDQIAQKRCGHRPNKSIVSKEEMVDRIKAAVDARVDENFVIMARTDALAVEGLDKAIERAVACVEAGADMIFPEAITDLHMYQLFAQAVKVPILANITEFGATPLYSQKELAEHQVSMVLYPLSSFRAASKAAWLVYQSILKEGHQKNVIDLMQTRMELYQHLNYHQFEEKLDELYKK
ncbi:methylisocitrate lyase [Basilea psittacipulmonis]|uniref:2-methylisocitrate lyase n=1 Tax=Basilea psittacipulmonis DSM 24701 TaxID=1072685 RepID=A0A077DAU8_9BURK|nr:methylisocitrate lyase [Basilea psittacipulmonis]AIL32025.1 2-methylisocitrate lyase [Basilea psittacipulmonis DSM 24701]